MGRERYCEKAIIGKWKNVGKKEGLKRGGANDRGMGGERTALADSGESKATVTGDIGEEKKLKEIGKERPRWWQ